MFVRSLGLATVLLSVTATSGYQADQAASAEKQKTAAQQEKDPTQKQKTETALADLRGATKFDPATMERGRKVFVPNCGFCHGSDARGKSGPDLVRSTLVLHDKGGDTIGPVIRNGRTERGMPAFSSLTPEQIADISTFLHSRAGDVSNRFAYKIGNVVTGSPQKGSAFFHGAGQCSGCHSPTGDLAHVAGKYDAVELQRRMLYPAPNMIDVFLGKAVKPPARTQVTVMLTSGEMVVGTLDHLDEFEVSLHDANGWHRSYSRSQVQLEIKDPRAAHEALLPKYTDEDMHNVLAYLETLK